MYNMIATIYVNIKHFVFDNLYFFISINFFI